jgi:hypothetical protein
LKLTNKKIIHDHPWQPMIPVKSAPFHLPQTSIAGIVQLLSGVVLHCVDECMVLLRSPLVRGCQIAPSPGGLPGMSAYAHVHLSALGCKESDRPKFCERVTRKRVSDTIVSELAIWRTAWIQAR